MHKERLRSASAHDGLTKLLNCETSDSYNFFSLFVYLSVSTIINFNSRCGKQKLSFLNLALKDYL